MNIHSCRVLRRAALVVVAAGCSILFSPFSVFSEARQPPLKPGMTYSEVLRTWGPPESRDELETRRETVWGYRLGKVYFRRGIVSAWFGNGEIEGYPDFSADEGRPTKASSVTASPTPSPSKNDEDAEVDDLLSEIMKDIPSDNSESTGSTPPTMPPPPQGLPGVVIPPLPPPAPIDRATE